MSSPTTATPSESSAAAAAAEASAIMHAIKHKGEHDYPIDIWYFLACTVGVAALLNVFSVVWAFWRRRMFRRALAEGSSSNTTKTLDLLPRLTNAIVSSVRIVAFRLRVPTVRLSVLEALLTAIYLMALLIWLFANTQQLTIKDYSDRSGHIAGSQIPLIVGLSMKNNIIGYLTGVGHEKLHVLHRTIARSVFVVVLVHGFSRVAVDHVQMVEFGWTRLGLASGIIYAIIILMSFSPIRKRFFEIFYMFHVVLVFALILIAYLHAAASNFGYYVWPAFVVWGFDRVCRYLRYLILMDLQSPFNPTNQATLELLSIDTMRITACRGQHLPLSWKAGQHMYIALPSLGPVESHPFTIASIANDDSREGTGKRSGKEMVWIVRTRDGFTKRIAEYVTGLGGKGQVPVFMHGPYGSPPNITPYSTCIFIAGGSGITYTLPRMRDLLIQASKSQACARRLVFVWAIRHASHSEWLSAEFEKAISTSRKASHVSLSIQIYITSAARGHSPSLSADDVEKGGETPTPTSDRHIATLGGLELEGAEVMYGRPNISVILEDTVRASLGPVSVDVSGPSPLLRDVRKTLSGGFASPTSALKGVPSVQLNVETFSL